MTKMAPHRKTLWLMNPHCMWCGVRLEFEKSTVEHVLPRSMGGTNHVSNLAIACAKCNSAQMNLCDGTKRLHTRWLAACVRERGESLPEPPLLRKKTKLESVSILVTIVKTDKESKRHRQSLRVRIKRGRHKVGTGCLLVPGRPRFQ